MSLLAGEVQPALLVLLNSAGGLSPLWSVREGSSPKAFVTVLDDSEYPAASTSSGELSSSPLALVPSPSFSPPAAMSGRPAAPSPPDQLMSSPELTPGPADPLAFDNRPLPRHPDGRTDWTGREAQRAAYHRPRHASRAVAGRVVHLQSPRPDTWIEAGGAQALGVALPFLGLQFKRLGRRGLALELGVADARGRAGVLRLSSWKTAPSLHASRALLHLPLALPDDAHRLSEWAELSVDVRPLVALFGKMQAQAASTEDGKRQRLRPLPEAFHSIRFVRIYANCRVRRVWASRAPGTEFPLVAA